MKRVIILLVALLLATPLALGAMAGLAYYSTSAEHIPQPSVTLLEQTMKPCGYNWYTPVFGGLLHRDFVLPAPGRIEDIGEVDGQYFTISVPEGYSSNATLSRMGEVVWSGRAAELDGYSFADNGRYRIMLECTRPAEAERGYGTLYYQGAFTVTVEPRYETSEDWVTQGDVMAIRIFNLGSAQQPHAESDLGEVAFVPGAPGQMTAYVPIGYDREPGSYVVYAGAGRANWEIPLRVSEGGFSTEPVLPAPGEMWPPNASDNPGSYPDFQQRIAALYEQRDAEQYWDGIFLDPVFGETAVEYGHTWLVGEAREPLAHAGVDIVAEDGTEVVAANNGRVVFAGALESTGNTVVIEHGGGLKSYYFHLGSIAVRENDMAARGAAIGTVGATGVCAGPHLHYEVRIGQAALSPTLLANGTSRLYYFG